MQRLCWKSCTFSCIWNLLINNSSKSLNTAAIMREKLAPFTMMRTHHLRGLSCSISPILRPWIILSHSTFAITVTLLHERWWIDATAHVHRSHVWRPLRPTQARLQQLLGKEWPWSSKTPCSLFLLQCASAEALQNCRGFVDVRCQAFLSATEEF